MPLKDSIGFFLKNFNELVTFKGVGLIHGILTVKELFDRIMNESPKTVSQLAG